MPSSFYRRRFGNHFGRPGYSGYRPRVGPLEGGGGEGYYNYRQWGPRGFPEMGPRGYGRNTSPYNPNEEDSYSRGYGTQGYYNNYGENGGSGCGSFRCNQNGPYGPQSNAGGDGCGLMGCPRGGRPNYPFMGGTGGNGAPGGVPPSMMGRVGGGMWGNNNNYGGGMEGNNEMGMGGGGMGGGGMGGGGMGGMGGGEGPPTGGASFLNDFSQNSSLSNNYKVGIHMANSGYSYAGYIERQVRSTTIMMYTLVGCVPCQRAKHLLAVHYSDVKSHFLELVGDEDWQRQLQVDLQHVTGALTFPYIFICGNYIGGSSDLFALHQSGQLRRMVNACSRNSS
ncbi:hypothetical protein FO519_001614 [Halicephalobus sp. NKZ332]|nr:hypothetical protein FO519_001614 [Halicephalobus sp. NKZ332]